MTTPVPPSDSPSHYRSPGAVYATAPQSVGAPSSFIGGFSAWDVEKCPQRLPFPLQPPGKRPGLVLPCGVLTEQMTETRLPGLQLANRGPLRTHMTQPLQLGAHAVSTSSNPPLQVLSQSLGRADQVGQAALPEPRPMLIDPIAITDQDTRPIANARHKRGLGAGGMYLAIRHQGMHYHPQPLPITMRQPGGLVNVMNGSSPCDCTDRSAWKATTPTSHLGAMTMGLCILPSRAAASPRDHDPLNDLPGSQRRNRLRAVA